MKRLGSLRSIFADELPPRWIRRCASGSWVIYKQSWCTTFSTALHEALVPVSTHACCMAAPIITRLNRCLKLSRALCVLPAGAIAAWRGCCPARRDCCNDCSDRLSCREYCFGEEGA